MQPFQNGVRVEASTGWHDRIECTAKQWAVPGGEVEAADPEHFAFALGLYNYLACPPQEIRGTPEAAPFGYVFGRARGQRPTVKQFIVRQKPEALFHDCPRIPAPLFAGRLRMTVANLSGATSLNPSTIQRAAIGIANLSLNPLRYARHQTPDNRGSRLRTRVYLPESQDHLFKRTMRHQINGEYSPDGGDNWIPRHEDGTLSVSLERAAALRPRYFQAVFDCISAEINRAALCMNRGAVVPPFNMTLGTVETFWEFAIDSPSSLVASLADRAASFAAELVLNSYHDRRQEGNRVLQFKARGGVLLKIYAKTNKRLRIEVEHDFTKCGREFRQRRQCPSVTAVESALMYAREDAAMIVNDFLAHCDTLAFQPATSRPPVALMLQVLHATRSIDEAQSLLETLCAEGRLVTRQDHPLNAAIVRLKQEQVLTNRASSRVYRVTPQFNYALERIRTENLLPMFLNPMSTIHRSSSVPLTPAPRTRRPRSRVSPSGL